MKQLFLLVAMISCTTFAWTQNSFQETQPIASSPPNAPWDLHKYVWSHTHPLPTKGDKPILDFNAIENVTILADDLSISPDGKYLAYRVQHASRGKRDTLIVQATIGSWRQSFTSASLGFFSANSQQFIFQDKDNLCFLKVGDKQPPVVQEIDSYKSPQNDKGKWLAYQLKNKEATLILQDLLTETKKRFDNVANYEFDKNGIWLACQINNEKKELVLYNLSTKKELHFQSIVNFSFNSGGQSLVVKTTEKTNGSTHTNLQHISLLDGTLNTIWQTTDSNSYIPSYNLDGSGKQVVFIVQETLPQLGISGQLTNNTIWYWRTGMDKAILKANNHTVGIDAGLLIQANATFTDNDRYILFYLQLEELDLRKPNPEAAKLDVWSYKDTILQSTQAYLLKTPPKTVSAVIHIESHQVIRLENEYESCKNMLGDFAIISKSAKEIHGDRFWEKNYDKDSIWLVSLKNGSRRLIGNLIRQNYPAWFSPGGKYVVYFDAEQQCNYFSIDLTTKKLTNISAGIPAWQLGQEDFYLRPRENPKYCLGLVGWLENEGGLLVYDNYDIWQLDLAGEKPPVNITNSYGRKNHIQFKLVDFRGIPTALYPKTPLLLQAFNRYNKYSGFYQKTLGTVGNPELLYMGPCKLDLMISSDGLSSKITDTSVWILRRQTATQAPNFVMTTDFKNYKPLTTQQPHKGYNWLTAELHSFKQLDGTLSQGILYKPENFNPTKKYPVIIAFYGTLTHQLYQYPIPAFISSPSSPKEHPGWMASHGYLIFTPDIYFTKGQWGPSVLNTIDGAARYLSQLPFVDGKRLGAAGHSNSGRFGYYVLTHSKSFAAMSVGSGTTDVITVALALQSGGKQSSQLEWAEEGSYGGGLGSLWQNKNSWLDQTAVLHADKVISPLLLFHNKNDGAFSAGKAVAMFTALRRLEKRVWWLQYDDGGHTVIGKDAKDFTIRYTQYFDHYLKSAPPPRWMTEGIPAKYKQIENKYDLDTKGSCGSNCPVCESLK
jgi:dienelactone hydrolase